VAYLSVPQFLTFFMSPVEAVRASILLFAAMGFLGTCYLARIVFRVSMSASLPASIIFMFNNVYTARILVGHLTYQPFMVNPMLAAVVLSAPSRISSRWTFLRRQVSAEYWLP